MDYQLRISALNLKNIKTALSHRSEILSKSLTHESERVNPEKENLWGEDVKVVSKRNLKPKWLTPEEKDDVAERYKAGASMGELAREYKCHHTTIGSILRKKGVEIRKM